MQIVKGNVYVQGQFLPNKSLYLSENKIETIEDTQISEPFEVIADASDGYVIPGFIDLQLNGGGGAYFTNDLDEDGVKTIFKSHLKYGTTTFLPTLITTSLENILKGIALTKQLMGNRQYGVLGMHLEGPYFHPAKRGAHPPAYIRRPTDEELDQIISHGKEIIKIITFAPEIFDTYQLEKLRNTGWILSAGHSMATYQEAVASFEKGVSMVTHLYNAMSPLESRAPGLVGAALDQKVWTSIILDGVHLDYAAARVAYRLKTDRLVLISDASFKDAAIKGENLAGLAIEQHADGQYYTQDGKLAGSCLSMYEAMLNAIRYLELPLETAVELATARPAQVINDDTIGVIKPGNYADLVILNKDLSLRLVIQDGKVVNPSLS